MIMKDVMNITQAQYKNFKDAISIQVTIDGVEMSVPLAEGNRHYDAIMAMVEAGTLTIQEADSE